VDRREPEIIDGGRGAAVYMTSARDMREVADSSVDLMFADGVYLGPNADWNKYADLYDAVYVTEGMRIMKPTAYMISFHTDQYKDGDVVPRWSLFQRLFRQTDLRLIDVRIWKRKNVNLFQPPFTHVGIWAMPDARRPKIKGKDKYLQGVWDYPALTGGKLNAWPDELCVMMLDVLSKPGDQIAEPMCGTARLLGIAAHMGRTAIGYEIDKSLKQTIKDNLTRTDFGLL
jgi:DNA modification methylase